MVLFDPTSALLSYFWFLLHWIFLCMGGKRSGRKTYISGYVEVPTIFEEQSVL